MSEHFEFDVPFARQSLWNHPFISIHIKLVYMINYCEDYRFNVVLLFVHNTVSITFPLVRDCIGSYCDMYFQKLLLYGKVIFVFNSWSYTYMLHHIVNLFSKLQELLSFVMDIFSRIRVSGAVCRNISPFLLLLLHIMGKCHVLGIKSDKCEHLHVCQCATMVGV